MKTALTFRTYVVTVRPKHKLYAGSWASGEYTVEVDATDRDHAIRKARDGYEDSRVNPATFRARLK
jgi:hypothetical protein